MKRLLLAALGIGLLAACTSEPPAEERGTTESALRPKDCSGYVDEQSCEDDAECDSGQACLVKRWAPGPGLGCPIRACGTPTVREKAPDPDEEDVEAEPSASSPSSRCDEIAPACETNDDCPGVEFCVSKWASPKGSREMCRTKVCQ